MKVYISNIFFLFLFTLASHAQSYIEHQVKPGETIQSISQFYSISPSEIYDLNPDAKKNFSIYSTLIIPEYKKEKTTFVTVLKKLKKHKTKRKETLYSLSKKYNISEADIKTYNPFLETEPLRKGDKLKIPVFELIEKEIAKTDSTTQKLNQTEINSGDVETYTVKPKEGKWRIAYDHGITIQDLENANPDIVGKTLVTGQIIAIPKNVISNELDASYDYYEVLPKEGFYRLKVKLGLTKEELETLNPILKTSGLTSGMTLKIPKKDTLAHYTPKINFLNHIKDISTKQITVMLPFQLDRINFDSISGTENSIKQNKLLQTSLDFYTGVLAALDSLKKTGISLKVNVYDTKASVKEVVKIINENNFQNTQAVIGPLTSKCLDSVASKLAVYNTPVISPVAMVSGHSNLFQSRPSNSIFSDRVIEFVKSDSSAKNIIIISDRSHVKKVEHLKKTFKKAKVVYSKKDKEGKDRFFVLKEDIETVLESGKNIVFFETKNKGFVSNITSILASLHDKKDPEKKDELPPQITLTTTQINAAFKNEEVNNMHLSTLQFLFATTSKEYDENQKNKFIANYTHNYGIFPNKRVIRGFDLTMDTVLRLVVFEDFYKSATPEILAEYTESKFLYEKNKDTEGYSNKASYLVRYDDLNIKEIQPGL